ncbi:unnamed protein product [Moneuplotes crassus]|uniref:Uncharacterized protein n=1 Tax=Euplotes crassus TaxID=5936 RepID=A0AAD1UMX1_EUPCR|nr:unnamed protein product [Moneuplotes crassus]
MFKMRMDNFQHDHRINGITRREIKSLSPRKDLLEELPKRRDQPDFRSESILRQDFIPSSISYQNLESSQTLQPNPTELPKKNSCFLQSSTSKKHIALPKKFIQKFDCLSPKPSLDQLQKNKLKIVRKNKRPKPKDYLPGYQRHQEENKSRNPPQRQSLEGAPLKAGLSTPQRVQQLDTPCFGEKRTLTSLQNNSTVGNLMH